MVVVVFEGMDGPEREGHLDQLVVNSLLVSCERRRLVVKFRI
jgi:hypothetical protein